MIKPVINVVTDKGRVRSGFKAVLVREDGSTLDLCNHVHTQFSAVTKCGTKTLKEAS